MRKMMQAVLCVAASLLVLGLMGCGGGATSANHKEVADEGDAFATGVHHVSMRVDGFDPFIIAIDSDNAPLTSSNFLHLVEDGFYDGLVFHRAVDRFCLQGGSPDGSGSGGSDTSIDGEFSSNNKENPLADNYARGVVAMSRTNDPNSASSQFFVTLSNEAAPSLNGKYAAFGTIDEEGMAVVDQIVASCVDAADPNSGQIKDKAKQPVISQAKVVD